VDKLRQTCKLTTCKLAGGTCLVQPNAHNTHNTHMCSCATKHPQHPQVLVSIQGLILVPEPYFNEPGFEGSLGTKQVRVMPLKQPRVATSTRTHSTHTLDAKQ
jgi:hypothetical protein